MTTTAETIRPAQFPLAEVRTIYFTEDEVVKISIDPADKRLLAERDKHESQLRERIRAGQEFTVFEKPLLQAAREVINSLLSPLGRDVLFLEVPPDDARPLMAFLAEEKRRLAEQLHNRRIVLGGDPPEPGTK